MDRKNGIFVAFLLFLIVADASSARFRRLADASSPTNQPTNSTNPGLDRNGELDHKNEAKTKEVPSNLTHVDPKLDGTKQLNGTDSKSVNIGKGTENGRNSSDTMLGSPVVGKGATGKDNNTKGLNSSDTGVLNTPVNNSNADGGKNLTRGNSTDSTVDPASTGTNPGDPNGGKDSKTSNGDGKEEKKDGKKSSSELGVNETCTGLPNNCKLSTIIACIKSYDEGTGKLSVLVQNVGEKTLTVKLTFPSAVENPTKELKLSKHQSQMINSSLDVGKRPQVLLNAENGQCPLYTAPLEPEQNAYLHLPSYDQLATPINGAYFLILSVLIFGGTWACCKFRKRKWHDGVPYQELEMGLTEAASAAVVESAEGWDQGWDDDWDEDNAVKSPGAPRVGNISANGLTSRTSNRDGWEKDWDD